MNAIPKLGDDGELICPSCGENNLHHMYTTVYDRNEDDDMVMRTDVFPGSLTRKEVRSEKSGNPSRRRDAVVIVYSCEHCHGGDPEMDSPSFFHLNLIQHKGTTYLEWDYEPSMTALRTAQIKHLTKDFPQ